MTDTARNELAHKLGGTFGATAAPALNTSSFNATAFSPSPSAPSNGSMNGEARSAGDPESGIHPAMNPSLLSGAEPAPVMASPASSSIDLVLASVIESQVPPGWTSPVDELAHHELTVI